MKICVKEVHLGASVKIKIYDSLKEEILIEDERDYFVGDYYND